MASSTFATPSKSTARFTSLPPSRKLRRNVTPPAFVKSCVTRFFCIVSVAAEKRMNGSSSGSACLT